MENDSIRKTKIKLNNSLPSSYLVFYQTNLTIFML